MEKQIAYCGLNCEKCDAYRATVQNNDALREEVARRWSELNQVPITAEMINCMGCRVDGDKTPYCESMCQIRQCALKKEMDTCGDCLNMAHCETVGAVLANSPDARNNLSNIK